MSQMMMGGQPNAFVRALQKLKEGTEISLVPGINNLRIMPRFRQSAEPLTLDSPREELFWKELHPHWNVGPEGKQRVCRCLKAEDRQPCYVCEYIKSLQAGGHKQVADSMLAGPRFVCAAVPVDLLPDAKPKPLGMGSQILEGILNLCCNPQWGDCSDPRNGYVVSITKSGEKMNTRYTVQGTPTRMPVDEAWLLEYPDFDSIYSKYTYQQQQAIVAGQDPAQIGGGNGMAPPPAQAQFAAPPRGPEGAGGPGLPSVSAITPPPPAPSAGGIAPPPRVGTTVAPGIQLPPSPPPAAATPPPPPPTIAPPPAPAAGTITGGEAPREEASTPPGSDFTKPE